MKKIEGRNGGTLHILEKGDKGNGGGRPRKLVSHAISELKEMGIVTVTPSEIKEVYGLILQLTFDEVLELSKPDSSQKDTPLLLKFVAKQLLGKNSMQMYQEIIGSMPNSKEDDDNETNNANIIERMDNILIEMKNAKAAN